MKHIDVNLKALDKEHYLRRAPLGEIGAMFQPMDSSRWFPVLAALKKRSFNNLGDSWTIYDSWKATVDPYCEIQDEPPKTEW